ncbi:MAG: hypothetical protein ABSB79_04045 [Syntrophales bacterium]
MIDVKFSELKDAAEASYLVELPTSFLLSSSDVDRLRKAARGILKDSAEYQKLLHDFSPPVHSQ